MRILFATHTSHNPDAGASLVYHLLSSGLTARGHAVTALYGDDVKFPNLYQKVAKKLAEPRYVSKRAMKELRNDYDLVMSSSGMLYPLFRRLRPRPQRPLLISHLHGAAYFDHQACITENLRGHFPISRIYRHVTGKLPPKWDLLGSLYADLTIVQNSRDADYLSEQRLGPVELIPLGLHDEILQAALLPHASRNGHSLLWFGSWVDRKGAAYLPRAFEQIVLEVPEATLTLGGTGKPAEVILGAFTPQLRSKITVLPRISREQQIEVLRSHAVFLFPSLSEGFGFALLEAMAMGLAPVTTDTGMGGDYLVHGQNALLIPQGSSLHLARAAVRLIRDAELRQGIAMAAAALARTFTATRLVEHYEATFQRLVDARAR